jgi:hypothetical protein
VAGSCGHGNKPLDCIKCEESLVQLKYCQLISKDSVS